MGDSTSRTPGTHTGPTKQRLTQCQSVRTKKPVRIPVRSTRPRRCGWSNNYIALVSVFIATVIGLLSVREPDDHSLRRRMPSFTSLGIDFDSDSPDDEEVEQPLLQALPGSPCSRCNGSGKKGWFGSCARCRGSVGFEPYGHCGTCEGKKHPCAGCVHQSGTGKCTRCFSRTIRFGACARCGGSENEPAQFSPSDDPCLGEKHPCESCCEANKLCSRCRGSGRREFGVCARCKGNPIEQQFKEPCGAYIESGCPCKEKKKLCAKLYKLPPGWMVIDSDSGGKVYYDLSTHQTSFEKPV